MTVVRLPPDSAAFLTPFVYRTTTRGRYGEQHGEGDHQTS